MDTVRTYKKQSREKAKTSRTFPMFSYDVQFFFKGKLPDISRNVHAHVPRHLFGHVPEISWMFSWKIFRIFPEIPWKLPRNVPEISRTFSRDVPGKVSEMSRKHPGNFPEKFSQFSRKFHEKIPDNSKKIPRKFPEM